MLGVSLGALLVMTSCLSNDEETYETYSDTAITGITLGTLNRYSQTVSSQTGNDTVIKSTLTGSLYNMTIDQLNATIFNQDQLPAGTDLAHVLISSISTKNNGIATLKSLASDSVRPISSTDSIDFSVPRVIRVFSSDLKNTRDYTITLTIDPEAGVSFGWKKMTATDLPAGWNNSHLVAFGDTVQLVNNQVVAASDKAFRLNGTQVEWSADFNTWQVAGEASLKQLLGAGTKGLFALATDGGLMRSMDGGSTWQQEALDDEATLLPVQDIAMTAWNYAPLDSTDYLLLAGRDAEGSVRIWRKIHEYRTAAAAGRWVYMVVDGINRLTLPEQQNLSLVYYNNVVLALGSDMTVYQSVDQGITWRKATTYALPANINGSAATMAVDKNGYLWVLTDAGELWQGAMR